MLSDRELYEEGLLMDLEMANSRISQLEAILKEVDSWIEDLGVYADPTYKPAPIFLKVREVLNGRV